MKTNLIISLIIILMTNPFIKIFSKNSDEVIIEKKFQNWINNVNKESVNDSIVGFNFGLFDSEKGYVMYLIGSELFDKDNEDWATEINFEPSKKYFNFGKSFSKNKTWKEILDYSVKIITGYIESEKFKSSIFFNAVGITTGFDDGNLIIIYSKD